jgi:hypothetical protein
MNHATIEEQGLVERYFRGDLEASQEADFEEHFFACRRCQEELALARDLRQGIKAVAAEEAVRAVAGAGWLAWLARRTRLAQIGLAALAVALLAGLPAAWFLSRQPAPRLAGLAGPLADAPVFLLSTFRDPSQPIVIDLAADAEAFTLAVDAGADPRFASYRLTIVGASGEPVFDRGGLVPNALEVLMVTFPAGFLGPGDYRLTVRGVPPGGEPTELSGVPFRVVSPP